MPSGGRRSRTATLCFVINGKVWWKRTLLAVVTIILLHHNKHMKLVKPFTSHVIAWPVRKGFNQSICRTKEQETRLQCLASAMPKSVMPSAAKMRKVSEKKRADLAVLVKTQGLNRFFQQNFQTANGRLKQGVIQNTRKCSLAGHIDMLFFWCFCL